MSNYPSVIALLSILGTSYLVSASEPAASTLHTASELISGAKLTEIDSSGKLTFAIPDARSVQVCGGEVVSWGAWQPSFTAPTVWLGGGSWLAGEVQFTRHAIRIKPDWAAPIDVPMGQVGGVMLAAPQNPSKCRELIDEMLTSVGSRDLVWLTSGQKVSGLLTIVQDSDAGLQFRLGSETHSVALAAEEIRAIVFSPDLINPPRIAGLRHAVGLSDGSLVCVDDLARACGRLASSGKLTTVGGVEIAITQQERSEVKVRKAAIRKINYLSGSPKQSVLLSQMQPASYKASGQSLINWPLGLNKDVHRRLLTSGRGIQPRGIAMHATSQVAFRISEDCQRFLAEVTLAGVPNSEVTSRDSSPSQLQLGSVTCEVLVARGGKLERLANVELSAASERTARFSLGCSGSRLVVLVVREAGNGNYGDEVYWHGARLLR